MNKVALFGGTFDPVHLGHMACVQHLVENMDFSEVFIIPTSQNPLKVDRVPASKEDRLNMINLATKDFKEEITIDEAEIKTNAPSYSFETLKRYQDKFSPEEIYLVMGLDSFSEFDQWKNFEEILDMANLLVVSRPPFRRPFGIEDLPKGLQPLIHSYERGFALLKNNRSIEFVSINTEDISSTNVRKKLKTGKNLSSLIDIDVEKYIIENQVYPVSGPGQVADPELFDFVSKILKERSMNCVGYDLTGLDKLYDYTMIASATSTKAAISLADNIKAAVKEEFGMTPFGVEGREDGRWVILDYGSVIIHIFYDFVRQEYHLESLWKEGQRVEIK